MQFNENKIIIFTFVIIFFLITEISCSCAGIDEHCDTRSDCCLPIVFHCIGNTCQPL